MVEHNENGRAGWRKGRQGEGEGILPQYHSESDYGTVADAEGSREMIGDVDKDDMNSFTDSASRTMIQNIVMGTSDGLTVPFALAAGLSNSVSATRIVVIAGIAELVAGCVSMGLGGFLSARAEADYYAGARQEIEYELGGSMKKKKEKTKEILQSLDIPEGAITATLEHFKRHPPKFDNIIERFTIGDEEPDAKQPFRSAATVGLSYVVGGFAPLFPYILEKDPAIALRNSVIVTIIALFAFGWTKAHFLNGPRLRSALETTALGAIAATAAYAVASTFK